MVSDIARNPPLVIDHEAHQAHGAFSLPRAGHHRSAWLGVYYDMDAPSSGCLEEASSLHGATTGFGRPAQTRRRS